MRTDWISLMILWPQVIATRLRVLSTDGGQTGVAGITNLSLKDHGEFTVCGRILTDQFKMQCLISLGPLSLLATDIGKAQKKKKKNYFISIIHYHIL